MLDYWHALTLLDTTQGHLSRNGAAHRRLGSPTYINN